MKVLKVEGSLKQLSTIQGLVPESQGQNLAWDVLNVPNSLGRGPHRSTSRIRNCVPLRPYTMTVPATMGVGVLFLMGEVLLQGGLLRGLTLSLQVAGVG